MLTSQARNLMPEYYSSNLISLVLSNSIILSTLCTGMLLGADTATFTYFPSILYIDTNASPTVNDVPSFRPKINITISFVKIVSGWSNSAGDFPSSIAVVYFYVKLQLASVKTDTDTKGAVIKIIK